MSDSNVELKPISPPNSRASAVARIAGFLKRFYRGNPKKSLSLGAVLIFLCGSFFGQGALFQFFAIRATSKQAAQDRLEFESRLITQLNEYEASIYKLIPEYTARRDAISASTESSSRLEYESIKYRLIGLFVSYNKLEAKLSQLEGRGAQFMLPRNVIRPRPPILGEIKTVPNPDPSDNRVSLLMSLTPQNDEVDEGVVKQLNLMFEQYDDEFRDGFLLASCKLGAAQSCTRLASIHIKENSQKIAIADEKLLGKGCELGDSLACETLGFDNVKRADYEAAIAWLTKACEMNSGNACGLIGTLFATRALGEKKDVKKGRSFFEKGCELQSDRSCYYLALLLISGQVQRDEAQAIALLTKACALSLVEACKAVKEFDSFKKCSADAIGTPPGEGVGFLLDCEEPEGT